MLIEVTYAEMKTNQLKTVTLSIKHILLSPHKQQRSAVFNSFNSFMGIKKINYH